MGNIRTQGLLPGTQDAQRQRLTETSVESIIRNRAGASASIVGSTVTDATTSVKGKIRLGGHLAGTAQDPTIATTATPQIARLGINVAATSPHALAILKSGSLTSGFHWTDYADYTDTKAPFNAQRYTSEAITTNVASFNTLIQARGSGKVDGGHWWGYQASVFDRSDVSRVVLTSISGTGDVVSAAHTFLVGETIAVYGITGNTAANNVYVVDTVTDTTHFKIKRYDGTAYNLGAATGGTAQNSIFGSGYVVTVAPKFNRSLIEHSSANADDVNGLVITNASPAIHGGTLARATDGIWISNEGSWTGRSSWMSAVTIAANCDFGVSIQGAVGNDGSLASVNRPTGAAFDCSTATYATNAHPIRLPWGGANGALGITARHSSSLSTYNHLIGSNNDNNVLIDNDRVNVALWGGTAAPSNTGGRVMQLYGGGGALVSNTIPELKIFSAASTAGTPDNRSQGDINIYAYNTNGTTLERLMISNQGVWSVIGTVTSTPLSFWAFNTEVMRLIPGGEVAIGTRMAEGGLAPAGNAGVVLDNSGRIDVTKPSTANQAFRYYVGDAAATGDQYPRFKIGLHANTNAELAWGDPTIAAADVTLARSGVKELLLDGAIHLNYNTDHGYIEFRNQTGTVAAPNTAAKVRLYAKAVGSDSRLFYQNTTEGEVALGTGSGTTYPVLSGTTTDTLAVKGPTANTFQTIASNTTAGVARLSFLDQGTEKWRVQQGGGSGIETDFQFNVIDATDSNHLVRFMSGIPQSTGSTKHRWEYNVSATLPASGRRILNTNVLSTVTGTVSQPSAYDLIDVLQASAHLNTSGGANGISMVALIGEAKVSAAQHADNEVAYLRGASFDQTLTGTIHPTMWGQDLFVHGTRAASGTTGEQNRKIFNIVCGINTYHSSSPSHAPAVGMSITTKYGDVLGAPAGNTDRTHTVDTGLSIHGFAGDANGISHANAKIGFKYGIKIGGTGAWYSGDPWTDTTQHSRVGTGIQVMHYETAGIKVTNRSTIGATSPPAISIGWDNAGAASFSPMDGIDFGGVVQLWASDVNTLHTPNALGAGSKLPAGAEVGVYLGDGGRVDIARTTTTVTMLRGYVAGDVQPKVALGDGSSTSLGLRFGPGGSTAPDVTLYRNAAATMRCDGAFTVGGALTAQAALSVATTSVLTGAVDMASSLAQSAVGGTGFIQQSEQTSAVADPPTEKGRHYIRNNKFVVSYNDGGTVRWYYIDLTATANQQWTYSATDPA